MAFQFDTVTRTSWASALAAALNGGTLKVWSTSPLANCAVPDPSSGLLCTIPLPSPCLTAAAGVDTLVGSWTANASATGAATFMRGYDTSGNCRIQGNVSTDFILNNVNLTSGQPVTATTGSITFPGA